MFLWSKYHFDDTIAEKRLQPEAMNGRLTWLSVERKSAIDSKVTKYITRFQTSKTVTHRKPHQVVF